jgi:hypothetical protein
MTRMSTLDQELSAMQSIATALGGLEEEQRVRVLAWVRAKFEPNRILTQNVETPQTTSKETHSSFAELFDAARPKLEKDKALVAAYWAQVITGQDSFTSQSINSDLKNLGHGVANITDALSGLIAEKPSLILQLRKSGTSRQARKTYKISESGKKKVDLWISSSREEN